MQFGGQVNTDNQLTVVEPPPGDSPCWNAEGCELRAGSRRLRQVCVSSTDVRDSTFMPGHDTLPERKLFPQHFYTTYQSTTAVQFRDEIFFILFRIQLSLSLCNFPFYSLFVSGGAVSSEFNILCISGVNEFWQLCQINLRFSDISASTMSKHLFLCELNPEVLYVHFWLKCPDWK